MRFGELLRRFREEQKLTLRDLGKTSGIDHAYIYRLESGEKEAPSDQVVNALTKALRLDRRRARMLRFLVKQSVDDALMDLVLEGHAYDVEDVESAACMSFRGTRPKSKEDWQKVLNRIRQMREELERDR